ncbi:MAG: hypothetical protein AAGJ93_12775 [Bacteroidota bacterium]
MQLLNSLHLFHFVNTLLSPYVATVFGLILFIAPLNSQDWEPVCEGDRCLQTFEQAKQGNINELANIEAEGFRLRSRGSSGHPADLAAWSDGTDEAYLRFYHTDLNDAYEYRIRVVAKSLAAAKTIAFTLVRTGDEDHLYRISENHPIAQVKSVSQAGSAMVSASFSLNNTTDYGDSFYIIVQPQGAASEGSVVMIDDYVLERRLLLDNSAMKDFIPGNVEGLAVVVRF